MSTLVDREIGALQSLDTAALRARWGEAFGTPPPKRMSRDLLLRALAYHVQEQAEGGLSKAALKRLAALAHPKGNGMQSPGPATSKPRPGTRLVREWRGEVHQVTVCEDGFDYRGSRYASLSRIAREITGTRWSGPLFFGLRKTGARKETTPDGR